MPAEAPSKPGVVQLVRSAVTRALGIVLYSVRVHWAALFLGLPVMALAAAIVVDANEPLTTDGCLELMLGFEPGTPYAVCVLTEVPDDGCGTYNLEDANWGWGIMTMTSRRHAEAFVDVLDVHDDRLGVPRPSDSGVRDPVSRPLGQASEPDVEQFRATLEDGRISLMVTRLGRVFILDTYRRPLDGPLAEER